MHAIGLYLRIYENELKEEENLHIMYDYAHEDLHNDQDIIDLIGVNPAGAPPFVRQKAQIHSIVRDAVSDYADDIRSL